MPVESNQLETEDRDNHATPLTEPSPNADCAEPSVPAIDGYEIRLVLPSWLSPRTLFAPLFLVFLSAALFGRLQSGVANLINREAYYHLGFSRLMLAEGIRPSAKWIETWGLENVFNDSQILLHLILLPLLALKIDPVFCGKLITVLLDIAFGLSVYTYLTQLRVRWSFGFTALMLAASPLFIATLCEVDSTILIFIETLVLLYALENRRRWISFGVGWLAVYTSQDFPLLLLLAALFALFEMLQKRNVSPLLRLWVPVAVGCVAGVVVNPYFPNNLVFYSHQLIDPVFVAFASSTVIPKADAIDTSLFLTAILLPLGLLGSAGLFFLRARPLFDSLHAVLYFTTVLFFFAAMKWLRAVDYFIFLSVILSALMVSRTADLYHKRESWVVLKKTALGVLLFVFLPLAVLNLKVAAHSIKQNAIANRPETYRKVSYWLRDHTRAGELVIADLEDIPFLFFYNQHNYYPFGMKAAYRGASEQSLFLVYRVLFEGKLSDPDVFLDKLKSRYLVVTSTRRLDKSRRMLRRIRSSQAFEQLFSTRQARVYRLKTVARRGRSKQ